MTDPSATKPNLGPGQAKSEPGKPFFMSREEFIAVQTYCEAGMQLPITRDEVHTKLGVAVEDEAEFDDMISAYVKVHDHCLEFSTHTFPDTVALAGDLVDYGRNKAPVFYGALLKVIQAWQDGTLPPDKAAKKVDAILVNLKADAQARADKAQAVYDKVQDFATQTEADKGFLEPIKARYKAKYEGEGGLIATFNAQIENDVKQIGIWNEEYKKDVTIAATSATYAWIFPVGTIAAGVIAGVYGKKATEALDNVHDYQNKLATAKEDLRKAILLMADLKLADGSLDGLLTKLNAALPVIEKMKGIWLALHADIAKVLTIIQNDIQNAPVEIKDLGVDEAIGEWSTIASEADDYRVNAFITVTTEEAIKQDPQKYAIPTNKAA